MNREKGRDEVLLPNLVIPGVRWDDNEYASLRMRLDLYDDYIVARRFGRGVPGPLFVVEPLSLASAMADLPLGTGLLPDGCLFWSRAAGVERIGVYVIPQVWPVSVRGETETWRVPLPGLVFVGEGQQYQVYAVLERPSAGSALYHAPVPNMSNNGICRGNAPFPAASAETIWPAVGVFFESEFNRDLANGKSRAYPSCIVDHWQALHQAGAGEYPLTDLVEARVTLEQLME